MDNLPTEEAIAEALRLNGCSGADFEEVFPLVKEKPTLFTTLYAHARSLDTITALTAKLNATTKALLAIQSEANREGSLDHHLRRCAIVQCRDALSTINEETI